MALLRSIAAVVLGYALFAISGGLFFKLTGRNPHAPQDIGFILIAVVYGMVFAGLGGALAARMAPANGRLHAGFVTLLIALGAIVSLVKSPAADATWSQWSAILLMAPCAWAATAVLAAAPASPSLRRM